jgi:mannose-1-phosphate guanylyltransferase
MSAARADRPLKIAIFVGGSGTRLWPMSRKALPKQFQNLVGSRTMFQQMIDHLLSAYSPDDLFISTAREYVPIVLEQAPMLNPEHVIAEPALRDTTAAVGYAALMIAHRFPESLMATIWGGDHLIRDRPSFITALRTAHRVAAEQGLTVQINVRPTFPSTALGYVEVGEPILPEYGSNIYSFVRQVEKPDSRTARQFLSSVHFLWHSGYRVWDLQTLFSLYHRHVPEAYASLMAIRDALDSDHFTRVAEKEYGSIIKKSIDYTIFEHLDPRGQAVIAADLGWNDIGTWHVLHDELAEKADDNVTQGKTVLLDTTGSLVFSHQDKVTAVVGMRDVVVVDTGDALLVMPKDRSGDVKEIIEKLKADGLDSLL